MAHASSSTAPRKPEGPNRAQRRGHFTHSAEQIGAQYGVDPRTIRRWASAGIIEARRIGPRLLRFDPEQVADKLIGGAA